MAGKTESLTETLAKQAEAKFSAIAGVEKEERAWYAVLSALPRLSNPIHLFAALLIAAVT